MSVRGELISLVVAFLGTALTLAWQFHGWTFVKSIRWLRAATANLWRALIGRILPPPIYDNSLFDMPNPNLWQVFEQTVAPQERPAVAPLDIEAVFRQAQQVHLVGRWITHPNEAPINSDTERLRQRRRIVHVILRGPGQCRYVKHGIVYWMQDHSRTTWNFELVRESNFVLTAERFNSLYNLIYAPRRTDNR